jgi:transcriptional regulator with XRE-family HTH domain
MTGSRIGPKRPFRVYLREWREHLELTQEAVGNRFDPPVAKGQISKWEKAGATGRIGAETVAAYAEAINRKQILMYSPPRAKAAPPTLDDLAEEWELTRDEAVRALRIASKKAS